MKWTDKLRAFNEEWNDLPRRLLWIIILLLLLLITLLLFPYVAPFVLAAVFASLIDPAVRFITKMLGGRKMTRNIVSGVFVVLLATVVMLILFLLFGRIFEEIKNLAIAMPRWISNISTDVVHWIENLDLDWPMLEANVEETLLRLLSEATSMLTSLATRIASTVARGAWQVASFLPEGILFIVLTLMGTFYMSSDKERIFGYLRSLLPEKHRERGELVRVSILKAILTQLRAAMIMLFVTFTELCLGFLLMGMDYAVLLGLIIAVLDALPIIGAGLFLIPMCIYGIVVGNVGLAVGAGGIYLTTIVVRQLLEPRIIGKQLGLYPLATMMAMYAGLKAMGFLGMLLGPLMMLLCKVALTVNPEDAEPKPQGTHRPLLGVAGHRRKKG